MIRNNKQAEEPVSKRLVNTERTSMLLSNIENRISGTYFDEPERSDLIIWKSKAEIKAWKRGSVCIILSGEETS